MALCPIQNLKLRLSLFMGDYCKFIGRFHRWGGWRMGRMGHMGLMERMKWDAYNERHGGNLGDDETFEDGDHYELSKWGTQIRTIVV